LAAAKDNAKSLAENAKTLLNQHKQAAEDAIEAGKQAYNDKQQELTSVLDGNQENA